MKTASITIVLAFLFLVNAATVFGKDKKPELFSLDYQLKDNTVLSGWVLLPDKAKVSGKTEKFPSIILIHGGSSLSKKDKRFGSKHLLENKNIQKKLDRKFVVFSVDYKSDYFGDALEFESIKAAYDKFIEQPYVDKEKIFLVGISHGGFLALICSLDKSHGIKARGVVDISGVVDLETHVRFYEKKVREEPKLSDYDKYAVSGVKNRLGWPPDKNRETIENFQKRSAIPFVKDLDIPMLVIHGKKDKFVPFKHAEALRKETEKYKKKIEFHEISGRLRGNHFLIGTRKAVWEIVSDFLNKNLQNKTR